MCVLCQPRGHPCGHCGITLNYIRLPLFYQLSHKQILANLYERNYKFCGSTIKYGIKFSTRIKLEYIIKGLCYLHRLCYTEPIQIHTHGVHVWGLSPCEMSCTLCYRACAGGFFHNQITLRNFYPGTPQIFIWNWKDSKCPRRPQNSLFGFVLRCWCDIFPSADECIEFPPEEILNAVSFSAKTNLRLLLYCRIPSCMHYFVLRFLQVTFCYYLKLWAQEIFFTQQSTPTRPSHPYMFKGFADTVVS